MKYDDLLRHNAGDPDAFSREELEDIADRALAMSIADGWGLLWQRALAQLADAADRLDAMCARSESSDAPDLIVQQRPEV